MKAKHVFTMLGLALTMGLGVAAGLSHVREFKQAKADGKSVTIITKEPGWNNISDRGLHAWGEGNQTPLCGAWSDAQYGTMVLSDGYYRQTVNFTTSMEGCILRFKQDTSTKWQTVDLAPAGGFENGKTYEIKGVSWKSDESGYKLANASISEYEPVATYSYAVNGGAFTDFVPHEGNELKTSSTVDLKIGDVLTFKKNGAAYTINPKQSTKASMVGGQFTMLQANNDYLYLDYSQEVLWVGQYQVDDGLYVYGTVNSWGEIKTAVPMTLEAGVYTSAVMTVAANDVAKVAKVADSNRSHYYNIKDSTIATTTDADVSVDGTNIKFNKAGHYVVKVSNVFDDGENPNNSYATYTVEDNDYVPDVPEKEETYYLVGTETNWKYKNAPEMVTDSIYQEDNVAVLFGYAAKAGEEIKVRGVFSGEDKWYGKGGEGGENYVFESAGSYDIYLNSSKNLFVGPAATRHMATITCNKFAGKDSEGSVNKQQIIYEASQFNPSVSIDGYILRGVYTNAEMTTAYTPAVLHADTQLYAKFTKACYYMVGDDAFMGTDHGWNVDYAAEISTDGVNKLAGTVVIPEGASAEHPIAVKPLRFGLQTDGSEDPSGTPGFIAEYYTLGEERTFVELDGDGNFAFSESGTYAIYVNNSNEVYFNIGEYVFHAKFLSEVGAICSGIEAGTKTVDQLKAIWGDQKAAFNALVEGDQNNIKNVGFDGGDEHSSDDRLKMVAKYNRIITKYGTSNFEDFIWKQTIASNDVRLINNTAANNTALVVIIVATISVISAAGLFLVIRRRKHN